MDVVFGGGLWPIGQSVAFVELSLDKTLEEYQTWTTHWDAAPPFSASSKMHPLLDLLRALLPLEMPYRRRVLVGTAGEWTAIFDNSRGGGDPFPPASYLSRSAGVRAIVAGYDWNPADLGYDASQHAWVSADVVRGPDRPLLVTAAGARIRGIRQWLDHRERR